MLDNCDDRPELPWIPTFAMLIKAKNAALCLLRKAELNFFISFHVLVSHLRHCYIKHLT